MLKTKNALKIHAFSSALSYIYLLISVLSTKAVTYWKNVAVLCEDFNCSYFDFFVPPLLNPPADPLRLPPPRCASANTKSKSSRTIAIYFEFIKIINKEEKLLKSFL